MTIKKLDLHVLLKKLIKVVFSMKLISKKVKNRIVNIHQCLKISKKDQREPDGIEQKFKLLRRKILLKSTKESSIKEIIIP